MKALKPKDKKVIDAFYDKKKLEGKLLSTDGDKLEKLGMGRDTVAGWKGHKIEITSSSAVKSDDVILRYMKNLYQNSILTRKVIRNILGKK